MATGLTLGTARSALSGISWPVSLPLASQTALINSALEMLYAEGQWSGLIQRVSLSQYGNILTLPRQFQTMKAFNRYTTGARRMLFNHWYEFSYGGTGGITPTTNVTGDHDFGWSPLFRDISNAVEAGYSTVTISADTDELAGIVILRGTDSAGVEVYTGDGNNRMRGEAVTIGDTSANQFSTITEVVKPVTNADLNILAGGTVIASWQAGETAPRYRRYRIAGQTNEDGDVYICQCHLGFVPLTHEHDQILPPSINALELAIGALNFRRRNDMDAYRNRLGEAVRILDSELKQTMGGVYGRPQMQPQWAGDFRAIV